MSTIYIPQRYLANNRNEARSATLVASAVQSIAAAVLETQQARVGSAQVKLTGSYTGAEEALYEVNIVDTAGATNLISHPVFSGKGSGTMTDISATGGLNPQSFSVELSVDGVAGAAATLDVDGNKIVAAQTGVDGNTIHLSVDQSSLVFTSTSFSLLTELKVGEGSPTTGVEGSEFDWNTVVMGSDDLIPATAKRIAFGEDHANIYLQYKVYADNKWSYYFVPEIKETVKVGTKIFFVTGGRTVTITKDVGPVTETYPSIITAYDLLTLLKTTSNLVTVSGVVANDRSPTGIASRELALRTDARAKATYGSGSQFATGFTDITVGSNAYTELITAECFANTFNQSPTAHVGHELWKLTGSVSGDLGTLATGDPFTESSTRFSLKIPQQLPAGFGTAKGRFSVTSINYQPRGDGQEEPPICPVALSLGPQAIDQTVTLKYTARPTGDCQCAKMPVPNLDNSCLGNVSTEGAMAYQADTVTKLVDLYKWEADTVRSNSTLADLPIERGWLFQPIAAKVAQAAGDDPIIGFSQETFTQLCRDFELVLAQIDPLGAGAYRTAGFSAWAAAFTELQGDVATATGDPTVATPVPNDFKVIAYEDIIRGQAVNVWYNGVTQKYYASLYGNVYGPDTVGSAPYWSLVDVLANQTFTAYTAGVIPNQSGLTVADHYWPDVTTPGAWQRGTPANWGARAISTTEMLADVTDTSPALRGAYSLKGLPVDRYRTRLDWVMISAGLSPLGKADASILSSGDGCWRDYGGSYWWVVVGSAGGAYAPAFTNQPFYSCRLNDADEKYYSTHEFAFQINIKCPEQLLPGDEIVLSIGNAAQASTYALGDKLFLPLIAAGEQFLTGGVDDSLIQTWNVRGTDVGPLADFTYDPNAPSTYSNGGLAFTITPGGVEFGKGDTFAFTIERAQYRWRVNGGSWSATTAIPTGVNVFDSGLSIEFVTGASPSFTAGDTFVFRALQPWAASNLQSASPDRWQWGSSATANVVLDFGSNKDLDYAAIAFHTLPAGTTITLEGGTSPGVYTWSESPTWQAGTIAYPLSVTRNCRYVRVSLAAAASGGIGWLWLGTALQTSIACSFQLRRDYKVDRGSALNIGLNQSGLSLGKAVSGKISYTEATMTEADIALLAALFDWVKGNDDEPLVFIPNTTRTDAVLAQVLQDSIDITDEFEYHPDTGYARAHSLAFELRGIWQ